MASAAVRPFTEQTLGRRVTLPAGGEVEMRVELEPIWCIAQGACASYRMVATLVRSQGAVLEAGWSPAGEVLALNLAVLDIAGEVLRQEPLCGLHAPLHHVGLASASGRHATQEALAALPDATRRLFLCLRGLEAGAPHSKVAALAMALKPNCRGVIARAPGLHAVPHQWTAANLIGLSVDLASNGSAEAVLLQQQLPGFAAQARAVGPALLAYGVRNRPELLCAWASGFTHLCGPAVTQALEGRRPPLGFSVLDLYRRAGAG